MPNRPPSIAERLRSVWAPKSQRTASSSAVPSGSLSADATSPARLGDPGSEFAGRLRQAVAARSR